MRRAYGRDGERGRTLLGRVLFCVNVKGRVPSTGFAAFLGRGGGMCRHVHGPANVYKRCVSGQGLAVVALFFFRFLQSLS